MWKFEGAIAGMGTASGTRLVVGMWPSSPFGFFTDVMVQRADGHRTLLAPTRQVADFVSQTYTFDEVRVVPVRMWREDPEWTVLAGPLALSFTVGTQTVLGTALSFIPPEVATNRTFTSAIDPIARRVMKGVRTRGTAGNGRREWYSARDVHRITQIDAAWNGVSLGALMPVDPPVTFGFGSTPRDPSLVRVTTTVDAI